MSTRKTSIIMEVALTGATNTPAMNSNIPITPDEMRRDCSACYSAGARYFHDHARDPITALQVADAETYRTMMELIHRDFPGVPFSAATSRKSLEHTLLRELMRLDAMNPASAGSVEHVVQAEQLRLGGMQRGVDYLTTVTPLELALCKKIPQASLHEAVRTYSDLNQVAWKQPEAIHEYLRRMYRDCRQLGIADEIEITTKATWELLEMIGTDADLGLSHNTRLVLLFGFSAHLPISKSVFDESLNRACDLASRFNVPANITVGAVIPRPLAHPGPARKIGEALPTGVHDPLELVEWVAQDDRVSVFRTGLEDTISIYGRTPTNAELVAGAREAFQQLGIDVELDVDAVRSRLGLQPRTHLRLAS